MIKFSSIQGIISFLVVAAVALYGIGVRPSNLDKGVRHMFLASMHHARKLEQPVYIGDGTIYDMEGKPHRIDTLVPAGKTGLIVFWATWCPYCHKEFPALDNFAKWVPPGVKLVILPISSSARDNPFNIKRFYHELEVESLPQFQFKDGEIMERLGIRGFPSYLLVNGEGYAILRLRPDWERADSLREFLKYYL